MYNFDSSIFVRVYLDDVPEYMQGVYRCGSVFSENEDGDILKEHPELIDNEEFSSIQSLKERVAQRLDVSVENVLIEDEG